MYTDDSTLELETKTEDMPVQKDEQHTARVIAITSGKGGVGKTSIATNLGIALAAHQKKVCIFDADMGLANINILIGKEAEYSIEDVLSGERRIDEVMMDGPGGIKIVPASSGLEKILNLGPAEKKRLPEMLDLPAAKVNKQLSILEKTNIVARIKDEDKHEHVILKCNPEIVTVYPEWLIQRTVDLYNDESIVNQQAMHYLDVLKKSHPSQAGVIAEVEQTES